MLGHPTKAKTMRYNYLLGIWGAIALLAGFSGCTEKNDPKPAVYSQLLTGETSKSWKLTSVLILEKGKEVQSISASEFTCQGDDLYVFYADGENKFQVIEGASKCTTADPDIVVENTWSLVNSNATVSFIIPILYGSPLPFIIKSLTATQLSVELYFEDEDDTSYRFTFASSGK